MMSTGMIVLIIAVCVLLAASVLYGVFRKFTQMGWGAWQILIAWDLLALTSLIPQAAPQIQFYITLAEFVGVIAAVLVLGAALRFAMHKRMRPAHVGWRILDRVLGAVTAALNYAVFVLCLASVVLLFCQFVYNPVPDLLEPVFSSEVWEAVSGRLFDLVLVAIFFLVVRTGWRVGFARTLVTLLMIAATVGVLVLTILLLAIVPFFRNMVTGLSNAIDEGIVGTAISALAIGFLVFAVLFAVICVGGFFLTKLMRHLRYNYFWGFLDGSIGAVLALIAAVLVCMCVGITVGYLAGGYLEPALERLISGMGDAESMQSVLEAIRNSVGQITEWSGKIADFFSSSAFGKAFYEGNPFMAILPKVG